MIAVIFEVDVPAEAKGEYLDWAAELRPLLSEIDGFLSIERFQSLTTPGRLLSLSFWRDEAAVARWRNPDHVGLVPAEREYIDYMKSVRRTLDKAAGNGDLKADLAKGLVTEIEEAGYTDQRPALRSHVEFLQVAASEEVFQETRNYLIQKYARALQSQQTNDAGNDGPKMH